MSFKHQPDWDPRAEHALRDQRAAYDQMRETCPVAYSELLRWSVFRHADVVHILHHPEIFSSAVSRHLSVPSGMDPPEHTAYREIVERYFRPEGMAAFEPTCRQIARRLVQQTVEQGGGEVMAELALPFSVQVQGAFLGWPSEFQAPVVRWLHASHRATLTQDRSALSGLARQFESFVDSIIEQRIQSNTDPGHDLMAALISERVWDRPLSNEEITSILRNWTAGEVGTIASAVGILANFLAEHPELQAQLREDLSLVPPAIEEILRLDGPLAANRRVTTQEIEIGGRTIAAGESLSIIWISANRDGRVFDEPESFRWNRDPELNLLWGAGIHVCPGAPLARLEMRLLIEELLEQTTMISRIAEKSPRRAVYPTTGFSDLHLRMQ